MNQIFSFLHWEDGNKYFPKDVGCGYPRMQSPVQSNYSDNKVDRRGCKVRRLIFLWSSKGLRGFLPAGVWHSISSRLNAVICPDFCSISQISSHSPWSSELFSMLSRTTAILMRSESQLFRAWIDMLSDYTYDKPFFFFFKTACFDKFSDETSDKQSAFNHMYQRCQNHSMKYSKSGPQDTLCLVH